MYEFLRKVPLMAGLLERKRAEEALADMASFAEMNPAPVLRLDRHGTILLVNPAARELLGQPDLLGKSWYTLCPELESTALERVLQGNDTLQCETEVGERCLLFTHRASLDRSQVYVYGADITLRKRAEEALRESEERYHNIFDYSNDAIFIIDPAKDQIVDANPKACNMLGYSREELLSVPVSSIHPDEMPVLQAFAQTVFERGHGRTNELTCTSKSGQVFPAEMSASILEVGGRALMIAMVRDVTERKQAEEALRDSETMLRQSEKMAVLGTLTAGVAHELNNPAAAVKSAAGQLEAAIAQFGQAQSELSGVALTAVQQGALQRLTHRALEQAAKPLELNALARSDRERDLETWLEERRIPNAWKLAPTLVNLNYDTAGLTALANSFAPDQLPAVIGGLDATYIVYNVLTEIGQSAGRIAEIVKALKSYSYLDQAPVQAVDVHEGLDNTLLVLSHKLKSGINVRREYAPHLPKIQANGGELNQVWTNIIDNAADALEGRGEITIRTRQDGEQVVIEIEDDGPGIPAEIQSRIFDPFFTTKPPGLGAGLGLDISYNIVVNKHRGDIKVLSNHGKTCFQVWLPVNSEAS